MAIEGVGPIAATALIASVPNIKDFKNGRQFAAYLGLTPKQNSTGGKNKLSSITKRGDGYLRKLLVHGARAVILQVNTRSKSDRKSLWIAQKLNDKGWGKTTVAVANKNARVMWALLAKEQDYRAA